MELTDRVVDGVEAAASVLVLRPQFESGSDRAYRRLLVGESRPVHLLGICLSRSPRAWYDDWTGALGGEPAASAVVTASGGFDEPPADCVALATVSTPADLTDVGMQVTKYLQSWQDDGLPVVVSVDSLGPLLQYVSVSTLYRFLHALTGRLDAVGASGLFFFDPTPLDAKTVNTLKGLFDAAVTYDEREEWRVQTR